MRADILSNSLRGRQLRRLAGLTDPMLPGAGTLPGASTSATRSFATASAPTMRLHDTSSAPLLAFALPLVVRPLGPDTSGMSVRGEATPTTPAGGMPGTRFDLGPGGRTGTPDVSPVAEDPETPVDEATGPRDVEVTVREENPPAIVRQPASGTFVGRYKWWILGFFVALMGAGGLWMFGRPSRR